MASKAQRNQQQNFFAQLQTVFFGGQGGSGGGIVGNLSDAATELKAAANMLAQNTQAQPNYGGPNGGRPTFNGNGAVRPQHGEYPGGPGFQGTYSQARNSLASAVYQRAGSSGSPFRSGNTYSQHQHADGRTYFQEYDPQGNVVAVHNEGDAGFNQAKNGIQRQQAAGTVAGIIQNGSIFTRGANGEVHTPGMQIAQRLVHSIPIVGTAAAAVLGAPDAVLNSIVNQRAKNAQYQAILGGTNAGTGFHNRRLAEGFKLSQLYSGGFTGAQSEEIFKDVTNLGYTGNRRESALNFASSNYKNFGMGPEESAAFISIMAKNSSTNFEQLKTVLTDLNDTAKKTGQNLELARKNLAGLFDAASTVNGGAGALGAAANVATFQTSLGRDFQNVNFSGLLPGANIGITSMMANSVNMGLGQFEVAQAGGGPGARLLLAGAQDKQMDQVVAPALSDPNVMNALRALIQKNPGSDVDTLTKLAEQDGPFQAAVGPYIPQIVAAAQAFMGAQFDAHQAVKFLVQKVSGNTVSKQMEKTKQDMLQKTTQTAGMLPVDLASKHIYQGKDGHYYNQDTGKNVDSQVNLYTKVTDDPILKKFKDQYYKGNVHLKVQTAGGDMVVSGKYAYDHLKDQIAKGTAVFMDGDNAGQSVADVVGGGFAESNYQGKDTTKSKGNSHYKSVDAWNAKHSGSGGGTVTIAPSPALAKLLNITTSGNVTVANEAAAAGTTPSPNQTGIVSLGN